MKNDVTKELAEAVDLTQRLGNLYEHIRLRSFNEINLGGVSYDLAAAVKHATTARDELMLVHEAQSARSAA